MKIDKKKWIEKGFILQVSRDRYILGQGPFFRHRRPQAKALYHPDFFLTELKPWIISSALQEMSRRELAEFLFEKKMNFRESCLKGGGSRKRSEIFQNTEPPSFVVYQQLFFQIKQAIALGLFQKAVPALSAKFYLKASLPFFIKNLFSNTYFMKGFLYGFWDNQQEILGFTPELLFKFKNRRFQTMALAGTGALYGKNLLKDKKELKEHKFVVQSLEKSLEDFVEWSHKVQYELPFPPLKHIQTDLTGFLKKTISFEQICRLLHPTPALGGYPPQKAFEWLKNHERQKGRKYFGAPFGFIKSDEEAFCLVSLRALERRQGRACIFSGGGVLEESDLQKEWRELSLKRRQVEGFFK